MKNKKATYALGFAVLLVWGMILYRVFYSGNDQGQDSFSSNPKRAPKEMLNDYAIPPDTAKLHLNYRDPFGGEVPADTARATVSRTTASTNPPMALPIKPPAQDWGFIRYSGFVKNSGSKRLIAMVNIRGKDLMMSEGETMEDVRLIKNLHDSIKVQYKGKSRIITINNKAL